jgi:hypothetical protein
MRNSFLGYGLGGVALLTVGCAGDDILLTTAQGGASNGSTDAGLLGPWKLTADYPQTCTDDECTLQTCVANRGYAYCIGGSTDSNYFAATSATGLGAWLPTASYPVPIEHQTCVVDSDRVYCVAGYELSNSGLIPRAEAYFASLSPTGVANWAETTAFPTIAVSWCVASAGYIYCRWDSRDSPVYYAPLSASGIGTWQTTGTPPTDTHGCVSDGGYIYCFGGALCPSGDPDGDCYSPSYYAPLTSKGIGDWKSTSPLPTAGFAQYVNAGSYVYVLSTPPFAARLSANGIGAWETVANYPNGLQPQGCISTADHIYCARKGTNSSYFAEVGVANPTGIHLVNPPPGPRTKYLEVSPIDGRGGSVIVDGVMVGAPRFGRNIDQAIQFDCAADAATPAGCQKTIVNPEDATYNYDLTLWHPCPNAPDATTNCCFQPKLGYDNSPFYAWCASTDSGSFIVTQPIPLE